MQDYTKDDIFSHDELAGIELERFCPSRPASRNKASLLDRVHVVNVTQHDIESLSFLKELPLILIPNEEGLLHVKLPRYHRRRLTLYLQSRAILQDDSATMGSESESEATMKDGVNGDAQVENADQDGLGAVEDADLFGDGSDADADGGGSPKRRRLDDDELDSGDDEGRRDRIDNDDDDVDGYGDDRDRLEARTRNVQDIRIARHPIPRPSDGELYLFQLPKQLGIEPKPFHHSTFQPPTTDHSSTFSSYQTAINTARWRYSPSNPSEVQSNARVIRWSDGSLTVQLASNPREQFVLSAKALAPPQVNPPKPVPTAKKPTRVLANAAPESYDARLDSHTYLTTTHESAQILRLTNHITASLTVQSNSLEDDDALVRLQERMAAAKASKTAGEGGMEVVTVREDPELAKMKAEAAEKEKIKAQRKRQQQEERERDRANRVLGRSGLRIGGYGTGGLTVGGLEEDDGMGTSSRSRPSKPRKKPRRRNSEYSDDEDFRSRGRTKEDEYDEDDGFLVGSDEEPEVVDDGDEEEDVELGDEDAEGDGEEVPPAKPATAKREAADEVGTGGRVKRRRVIEEDEDE
ncbi:MAG: hypothetical protein Q9218_002900 [Villophora microphyllina]